MDYVIGAAIGAAALYGGDRLINGDAQEQCVNVAQESYQEIDSMASGLKGVPKCSSLELRCIGSSESQFAGYAGRVVESGQKLILTVDTTLGESNYGLTKVSDEKFGELIKGSAQAPIQAAVYKKD